MAVTLGCKIYFIKIKKKKFTVKIRDLLSGKLMYGREAGIGKKICAPDFTYTGCSL